MSTGADSTKKKKGAVEPVAVAPVRPVTPDPLWLSRRPVSFTLAISRARNVPSVNAKAHEKSPAVISCVTANLAPFNAGLIAEASVEGTLNSARGKEPVSPRAKKDKKDEPVLVVQTEAAKDDKTRAPVFNYKHTFQRTAGEPLCDAIVKGQELVLTLCDASKEKKPDPIGTFSLDLIELLMAGLTRAPPPPPPQPQAQTQQQQQQQQSLGSSTGHTGFPNLAADDEPLPPPEPVEIEPPSPEHPEGIYGFWYPVRVLKELTHVKEVPEVLVSLQVSEPILSEEERANSNILTVETKDLRNLPEKWLLKEGTDPATNMFKYKVQFPVPVDSRESTPYLANEGAIAFPPPPPKPEGAAAGAAAGSTKAGAKDSKPGAAAAAAPPPQQPVPESPSKQQQSTEDGPVDPFNTEAVGQRVVFNKLMHFFLGPAAVNRWREELDNEEKNTLVIDITRHLKEKFESNVDHNFDRYHGQVRIPYETFLSPGLNFVSQAFPVVPAPLPPPPTPGAEGGLETGKRLSSAGKTAPASKGKKLPELEPEENVGPVHPFEAAKTELVLRLRSYTPIIPRLPTPPPKTPIRPRDLIPTRPPLPRYPVLNPSDEFVKQCQAVIRTLAEEYRGLFEGEDENYDPEERRKRLVFELNQNGKYFTFKEKLKQTVIKIARERYHSGPDANSAKFHNDLYQYLLASIHKAMNEYVGYLDTEAMTKWKENLPEDEDAAVIKLATEAELLGRFERAQSYFQQRIAKGQRDPVRWYDYGAFLSRRGDLTKAEECFREAIALDPNHVKSLLAHGCILFMHGETENASVFIKGAYDSDSLSLSAGVTLSLHYEMLEQSAEAKSVMGEVYTNLTSGQVTLFSSIAMMGPGLTKRAPPASPYLAATDFYLEAGLYDFAEWALARDEAQSGRSVINLLNLGRLALARNNVDLAEEYLQQALEIDHVFIDAWVALGLVQLRAGRHEAASHSYETAIAISNKEKVKNPNKEITDMLFWLNVAEMRLAGGDYDQARDMFYKACEYYPTATSWIGVARTYIPQEEYDLAEEALGEASYLDPRNAQVWGNVALVCLAGERIPEADKALHHCLRLGGSDAALIADVARGYLRLGSFKQGISTLRRSLAISDSPAVRLLLASTLVDQGEPDQAVAEFKRVLDRADAVTWRKAITQLVSVLITLERSSEAEQYKSMAASRLGDETDFSVE